MSVQQRYIRATPQQVWDVLADGWLYPVFVVGASRMRDVDPNWPAVGARLHHSVGVWPLLINDDTEVLASEPVQCLTLQARGWPAGEATVTFTLTPQQDGTLVTLREDATSGPGRLVPRPIREVGLKYRNTETLRRLAHVAEGRSR